MAKIKSSDDIDSICYNSGRNNLIVCSECKDIGCGLISVNIIRQDKFILWNRFAYQDCDELYDIEVLKDLEFTFNKDEYENTLNQLKDIINSDFLK